MIDYARVIISLTWSSYSVYISPSLYSVCTNLRVVHLSDYWNKQQSNTTTWQHPSISESSLVKCPPLKYTQTTLRDEDQLILREPLWLYRRLPLEIDEHQSQATCLKPKWNCSNLRVSSYQRAPKILLGCCFAFIPPQCSKKVVVYHLSKVSQDGVGFIHVISPGHQSPEWLAIVRCRTHQQTSSTQFSPWWKCHKRWQGNCSKMTLSSHSTCQSTWRPSSCNWNSQENLKTRRWYEWEGFT